MYNKYEKKTKRLLGVMKACMRERINKKEANLVRKKAFKRRRRRQKQI